MMHGAAEGAWKLCGIGAAGLVMLAALGGCVGYASYPYEEGGKNTFANQDPNTPPADELIYLSLDWVTSKFPPPGGVSTEASYAINIPKGVRRDVYDRILKKLGDKAAPLTPETAQSLPIYHIGRLWVRGRNAKVDVLRPVLEGPRGPGGQVLYQPVTLRIEGGFEPWRVRRHQVWEVGTVPIPELYYYPDYDGARRQYYPQARMPETHPVVDVPDSREPVEPLVEDASTTAAEGSGEN
ncbi:MAG: hypothetical protein IT436_01425 [Phycisphaerales bacterium]|nr:hypothetical protein [Phycisphaerales bacterium]